MVWFKDQHKQRFSLYNLSNMKLVSEFQYISKFDKNKVYIYTQLEQGEKLVLVDPSDKRCVILYDFYNHSMNRLVLQNSLKYKKIKVDKISKFLNFNKFWLKLTKIQEHQDGSRVVNEGYVEVDKNLKIVRKLDMGKQIDFIEKLSNKDNYVIVSKNELLTMDYANKKAKGVLQHSRNLKDMKVTKHFKILVHLKINDKNLIKMINP